MIPAKKIRRARILLRWRRWRNRYMFNEESLDKIQKAGLRVLNSALADRVGCALEHCPVTNKRIATGGGHAVILERNAAAFAGPDYYYVVSYPHATYDLIIRDFDVEMKKRLAAKHRRVLASVEAGVAGAFARADSDESARDAQREQ
jgi:hypothetical protein